MRRKQCLEDPVFKSFSLSCAIYTFASSVDFTIVYLVSRYSDEKTTQFSCHERKSLGLSLGPVKIS